MYVRFMLWLFLFKQLCHFVQNNFLIQSFHNESQDTYFEADPEYYWFNIVDVDDLVL